MGRPGRRKLRGGGVGVGCGGVEGVASPWGVRRVACDSEAAAGCSLKWRTTEGEKGRPKWVAPARWAMPGTAQLAGNLLVGRFFTFLLFFTV